MPAHTHLSAVFTARQDSSAQVECFLALVDERDRNHLDQPAELPAQRNPRGER